MDPVEDFEEFLFEQGLPTEMVKVASDEKLTREVMLHFRDSDLAELFPRLGDRLLFRPIMDLLKVSSYTLICLKLKLVVRCYFYNS